MPSVRLITEENTTRDANMYPSDNFEIICFTKIKVVALISCIKTTNE